MKNSVGERIRKRRLDLGMSQEELATLVGYESKSTINKIESGVNTKRGLNQSKIKAFADALQTTPSYIMGWEDDEETPKGLFPINIMNDMIRIPIFRYIPASCGLGSWSEDDVMDYISLPGSIYKFNKRKKYFGQIAEGDSMIGVDIEDGNLLIFEQHDAPENNMVGVFSINNEKCFCKRIKFIKDKIYLVSANDNYMPIEITSDMEFRMVGLLKYVVKEFRQDY